MSCAARKTCVLPTSERFFDMEVELTTFIGRELEAFDRHITRDAIGRFASAIGESDPIYHDAERARAIGMKDVPVPPTFLITLEIDHRDTLRFIRELGLDAAMVLHGEQAFYFRSAIYAGDQVRVQRSITGAGVKGKTLGYILTSNLFLREGEVVATSECTWLVGNRSESS